VTACTPRLRRILNPKVGELRLTITELAVSSHPDLILFIESPADDETRAKLLLTRRQPTEQRA
jgi:hypothetical protein